MARFRVGDKVTVNPASKNSVSKLSLRPLIGHVGVITEVSTIPWVRFEVATGAGTAVSRAISQVKPRLWRDDYMMPAIEADLILVERAP